MTPNVQACQGQETDPGSSVDGRRRRHTSTDSTATYKIPNYVDFLVFQVSVVDIYVMYNECTYNSETRPFTLILYPGLFLGSLQFPLP